MLAAHAAAIFLGAFLLFLVEPLIAKIILPRLGGSPSVWIACMLFFQWVLLAGYAYAHGLSRRLAPRWQAAVHGVVLLVPLALLPIRVPETFGRHAGIPPTIVVLGLLAASVGLPFFALSATGPLVQRWFATTGHREARDPYFLYAASNAGSLVALLGYPLLVEPELRLAAQTAWWTAGYVLFVALMAGCAAFVVRGRGAAAEGESVLSGEPVTAWRRLRWLFLAFVPSSVLLAASQFLTTDVAPIPLLWVLPLALYLLTFILAFSRRRLLPQSAAGYGLAIVVLALAASFPIYNIPMPVRVVLHLAAVFAVGAVCHGALAEDRPPASGLTGFYLVVSVGGALGGLFNALVAPVLFDTVLEYPIGLVLACLARVPRRKEASDREPRGRRLVLDAAFPLLLLGVSVGLRVAAPSVPPLVRLAIVAAPALPLLVFRPVGFAAALVAAMVSVWNPPLPGRTTVYSERTFFGLHRVQDVTPPPLQAVDATGERRALELKPYRMLGHGTTIHGVQYPDPDLATIATAYFHRSGPAGQAFAALGEGRRLDRIAVIGLGAGTLAAYGKPGRTFTFVEIDPEVERIARDSGYFTFLRNSRSEIRTVVGDGRLEVERFADGSLDLLVVDAFSSDSIPVHLITREAVALYFRKLAPEGLLLLHLTNEHLDLVPVADAIASDLGLAGLAQDDETIGLEEKLELKYGSLWVVLARERAALGYLADDPRWERLPRNPGRPPSSRHLWTDDYSNLLGVFKGW